MWQKRPKKVNQKRAGQNKSGWPSRSTKAKPRFADDLDGDPADVFADVFADDSDDEFTGNPAGYDEAGESAEASSTDLLPEDPEPPVTLPIVLERAMRLLVRREHGRKELELKLLQRDLPLDLIESALDNLAEEGLQCDHRFAEVYTRMRVSRLFGANKIRADLLGRQLDSAITENAIECNEADWTELALEALQKKFGRGGSEVVFDFETRVKLQRYLYRRGFESSEIKDAISEFEVRSSQLENDS